VFLFTSVSDVMFIVN